MSGGSALQAVAFGDVDGRTWGAAVDGLAPALVFGSRGERLATTVAPWTPDGRGWRIEGDGVALHVEPVGEEGVAGGADGGESPTGFQELCRVTGELTLVGAEQRVDCTGTRCALEGVDRDRVRSARAVSGWFGPDDAFMLLALRGGDRPGQEADLVAATLFDPEGWVPVGDPRLSTTYDEDGIPRRTNLELWVGEGESEFPRRAAAEAAAAAVTLEADGLTLRVVPLRCHSRGREGAGVYVLAGF